MLKNRKISLFLLVLLSLFTLFGCKESNGTKNNEKEENHTFEIKCTDELELFVDEEKELDIKFYQDSAEIPTPYDDLSIRSQNSDVAYYDDGKIVSLEVGETNIEIKYKKNKDVSTIIKITVKEKPIEECPINIVFPEVNTNLSYGDMEIIEFTYECKGEVKIEYVSENDCVTVNLDEKNIYKVVANNKGETTVKFTLTSSTDKKEKEYKFTVNSRYGNIRYELDDGILAEGSPVRYEEGCETQLLIPTKEGKKFLGWSIGSKNTDYVTLIDASKTGDIVLYANWE